MTPLAFSVTVTDVLHRDLIREVLRVRGHREVPLDLDQGQPDQARSVAVVGLLDLGTHSPPLADLLSRGCRVLLVGEADGDTVAPLLFSGASGFLALSETSPRALVRAVETVASGDAALSPAAAQAVLELWRQSREASATAPAASPAGDLSDREREVLARVAAGQGARLIARELGIAEKTVENHKTRLYSKLGVKSQAQAVAVGIRLGLVNAD